MADELAAKNKEIDDRQDLTAEEKAKAKAEAQAAADKKRTRPLMLNQM